MLLTILLSSAVIFLLIHFNNFEILGKMISFSLYKQPGLIEIAPDLASLKFVLANSVKL